MPKVQPPPYPSALTVAAWNKAKGILARIKQIETGITKELQAAAKQFNDAPWKALDVTVIVAEENKKKMPAGLTVQDLETIQRGYLQTYQPTFKQLQGRFAELHSFLKDKAVSLAEDDATKGFAKAVELMAEEANKFTYAVAWGTVSSDNQKWLTLTLENRKKEVAIRAKAKEDLVSMIDKAITEVKNVEQKAELGKYKTFWKDNLRGITAQIKLAGQNDPQYLNKFSAPISVASKQWSGQSVEGLKTTEDIKHALVKDKILLGQFKNCC